MSSTGEPSGSGRSDGGGIGPGFLFGVATAGFQVEGGYNGPGQVANNWLAWEQVGRVEPSGDAVGFWDRPEEALDRAAALGCTSFRLSVEWARVVPDAGEVDRAALARYRSIVDACAARGLAPLVTLHHFTHPAWLGEDFWLRPDAPDRFGAWAELAVETLAGAVRHWVTINEINSLAIGSWLLGMFPPGRVLSHRDMALATDHLLAAHVAAYAVIHRVRPDAVVTTNNACLDVYELDQLLTDVLLSRSLGVGQEDLGPWLTERRREHDALRPADGPAGVLVRRMSSRRAPYGAAPGRPTGRWPRRAVEAVYASPHRRTLDVVGLDVYDPRVADHIRLPGHRTAGGRTPGPTRPLWDDVPDPAGLGHLLRCRASLAPGLPVWVVENGLCNRVRNGRSYPRTDGWDRPRYLRENIAAVVAAADGGVPVTGYWHWSLVDNYEWGSYEPRFGLYGMDRHRGGGGVAWMETDAMGDDSAGTFRGLVAGLSADDRSVLDPD